MKSDNLRFWEGRLATSAKWFCVYQKFRHPNQDFHDTSLGGVLSLKEQTERPVQVDHTTNLRQEVYLV